MSIRIISSRKFRFYSPDRQENIIIEVNNIISTVPDWAVNDGTFQAARAAGLIQILSSKQELKQAENNPEKVVPQNAHEDAPKKDENPKEADLSQEEEPELFQEAEEVISEDDQDDGDSAEAKEAAKKAARKAARAARKAKKAK